MRFVRRGARRQKRTVAWIDGLTGMDISGAGGVNYKTVALTVVDAAVPLTLGSATALTVPADLYGHGGEDAVITRIRGRLRLFGGTLDTGAGPAAVSFPLRISICKSDLSSDGARVMPTDLVTSAGLGRDNILWMTEVNVSAYTGFDSSTSYEAAHYIDIDVRAKRKLQMDSQLNLWFHTTKVAVWTSQSVRMSGYLRMLLMRPR